MRSRRTGPTGAEVHPLALIRAGAGARLVGVTVSVTCSLAATALAVRLLDAAEYGVVAFGLSTVALAAGFGRIGLETALTRAVAVMHATGDREGVQAAARAAVTMIALTTALGGVFVVALVLARRVEPDLTTAVAVAACLLPALVGAHATAVATSLARGLGRMFVMEAANLVLAVAALAGVAAVWALGADSAPWVALAYGLAGVAATVAAVVIGVRLIGSTAWLRPSRAALRTFAVISLPFGAAGLANLAIARFDVVVLGLVKGSAAVGVYEPTVRLAEKISLPLTLFAAPFIPAATRIARRDGAAAVTPVYLSMSKFAYIAAVPLGLALVGFPAPIVRTLFGAEYPVRRDIIAILAAGGAINVATGLNTGALVATAGRRRVVQVGAAGLGAMVVLALALIPPFGAVGAALATAGGLLAMNVVCSTVLARATRARVWRRDLVLAVATSAAPVAAAVAIDRWRPVETLGGALAWTIELWLAWILVLLAIRALTARELRGGLRRFAAAESVP